MGLASSDPRTITQDNEIEPKVLYLHARRRKFVIGIGLKDRCDEFTLSLSFANMPGKSCNQALAGLPVALFAIIYRLPTIRGVGVVQSTVDYATASFEDCNPSGWRERIHPPQVQFL